MMLAAGVKNVIACDENGILYKDRGVGIQDHKKMLCEITNKENLRGDLSDAIKGADVFIGVSVAGALKPEMAKTMAKDAIVFAMANPTPEILPDEAKAAGVGPSAPAAAILPTRSTTCWPSPAYSRAH